MPSLRVRGTHGPDARLLSPGRIYTCSECRKQFTVKIGATQEGSKLPLSAWLQASHMLNALPKTVTVREVERALGVTYKTAWIMVQKLLGAVEDYRGPLRQSGVPVFGATVCARVEPLLPKTRNTVTYWKAREARKRKGTYKGP